MIGKIIIMEFNEWWNRIWIMIVRELTMASESNRALKSQWTMNFTRINFGFTLLMPMMEGSGGEFNRHNSNRITERELSMINNMAPQLIDNRWIENERLIFPTAFWIYFTQYLPRAFLLPITLRALVFCLRKS